MMGGGPVSGPFCGDFAGLFVLGLAEKFGWTDTVCRYGNRRRSGRFAVVRDSRLRRAGRLPGSRMGPPMNRRTSLAALKRRLFAFTEDSLSRRHPVERMKRQITRFHNHMAREEMLRHVDAASAEIIRRSIR
jgi:hypothetical protein